MVEKGNKDWETIITQDTMKKKKWFCNWRGVWNKALSDFWCNVKFS